MNARLKLPMNDWNHDRDYHQIDNVWNQDRDQDWIWNGCMIEWETVQNA